jgi:hypothetical protein
MLCRKKKQTLELYVICFLFYTSSLYVTFFLKTCNEISVVYLFHQAGTATNSYHWTYVSKLFGRDMPLEDWCIFCFQRYSKSDQAFKLACKSSFFCGAYTYSSHGTNAVLNYTNLVVRIRYPDWLPQIPQRSRVLPTKLEVLSKFGIKHLLVEDPAGFRVQPLPNERTWSWCETFVHMDWWKLRHN